MLWTTRYPEGFNKGWRSTCRSLPSGSVYGSPALRRGGSDDCSPWHYFLHTRTSCSSDWSVFVRLGGTEEAEDGEGHLSCVRTEDLRPEYRWLAERTYCWVVGWHTHFLCLFCPLRKNEEDCQEVHPKLRRLAARKVVRRGVRLPKMQLRKPVFTKDDLRKVVEKAAKGVRKRHVRHRAEGKGWRKKR